MKLIPKKFLVPVAAVALAASTMAGTASAVSGSPVTPATTAVTTQVLPDATAGAAPIVATVTSTVQRTTTTVRAPAGITPMAGCVASGTWYETWSLNEASYFWGVAWSETQKGEFYFNGCNAWQAVRAGYTTLNGGYHQCNNNHGLFTITVTDCFKYGDPSPSMELGDQFKLTVGFKGLSISATHEMAVCASGTGQLPTCVYN